MKLAAIERYLDSGRTSTSSIRFTAVAIVESILHWNDYFLATIFAFSQDDGRPSGMLPSPKLAEAGIMMGYVK
jgi:ABC-type glycerol-3-phosphate transport system permease component